MDSGTLGNHIIIAPLIYVPLEPGDTFVQSLEPQPRRTEIPMTWTQEGDIFRLDIDLPDSSVLDVYFLSQVGSLHVNGETIWEDNSIFSTIRSGIHVEVVPGGLRLTCTNSGSVHILAQFLDNEQPDSLVNFQGSAVEGKENDG